MITPIITKETWRPHNITTLHWGCPQWRHEEDGRQLELTVRSPYENLCSSIMHGTYPVFEGGACPICGAVV